MRENYKKRIEKAKKLSGEAPETEQVSDIQGAFFGQMVSLQRESEDHMTSFVV